MSGSERTSNTYMNNVMVRDREMVIKGATWRECIVQK
jgi:hypothetical protein